MSARLREPAGRGTGLALSITSEPLSTIGRTVRRRGNHYAPSRAATTVPGIAALQDIARALRVARSSLTELMHKEPDRIHALSVRKGQPPHGRCAKLGEAVGASVMLS